MMNAHSKIKTKEDVIRRNKRSKRHALILYNDDVNTFDHVINCLIRICQHDLIQAEQCAWLVHNKGKCVVKSGSFKELKSMLTSLSENGLSVAIK